MSGAEGGLLRGMGTPGARNITEVSQMGFLHLKGTRGLGRSSLSRGWGPVHLQGRRRKMKARVEITLHRERQELELGWGARCQRAWEEFGMGGGENDGMRPPKGQEGQSQEWGPHDLSGGPRGGARQQRPHRAHVSQPHPGDGHQDGVACGRAGPVLLGAEWGSGLCWPGPPRGFAR